MWLRVARMLVFFAIPFHLGNRPSFLYRFFFFLLGLRAAGWQKESGISTFALHAALHFVLPLLPLHCAICISSSFYTLSSPF